MSPNFRITSKTLLFFACIWMVFQFFSIRRWNSDLVWLNEMKSYYGYLPALFVSDDIGLEKMEMTTENQARYYYPQPGAKRGYVFKTSMGVAVIQAPFFLTAHIISLCGNDPEDGFSVPYRIMAVVAGLFYVMLGLFFIRKTLLYFFSDLVTSLVLVTLLVGTNLYYYTFYESGMSHAYSFALVSVLVFLTVSWHRSPSWGKLVWIGFVLGLVTLIRPVNFCLVLFFLLYRDALQITWKQKINMLLQYWKYIIASGLVFLLVLFPQLAYWKYLTGSWLHYSYGREAFFWLSPKIGLGLFSYQKGWLVWTPVMWFALIGLLGFILGKTHKRLFAPVFISLLVYIYIIFCWWCWWYGGGFGSRPMIDVMPILAFPLAGFFAWACRTKVSAYPVLCIWFFLIVLNLFQIRQYVTGKIHWAGMTKRAYWALFLNDYPKEDYSPYIKEPDAQKALRGESGLDE